MAIDQFTPCYIFPDELCDFGLPTPDIQGDIMNLVQVASSMIDTECGRIDGDGNGSLVYTTYVQRLLLQNRNRNLVQMPIKPITALTQGTIDTFIAAASGSATGNFWYTGVLPNTFPQANGALSGIVGASGRYGYVRQNQAIGYPDQFAFINPLNLITIFGGPAPWVAIDVGQIDYDPKTGEVWPPAGLQLQAYSELYMIYNSGYNPFAMPKPIKFVCAALVKNLLAKGDGTTGLKSMSIGRSGTNYSLGDNVIDPTLSQYLLPFKNVRSY